MGKWTRTLPPTWVPKAAATDAGWVDPVTGELLVANRGLATEDGNAPTPTYVEFVNPTKVKWSSGNNLDLRVTFTEKVVVTGSPQIAVTIGVNTRQAVYLSGSGTNQLIFRYTLVSGDTGAISLDTAIVLNGGTIKAFAQKDKLGAVTLTNVGSGYTAPLLVTFAGGAGSDGRGIANIATGAVLTKTITDAGTGYHQATTTLTFSDAPVGGITATGTVTVTGGAITAITITNPGAGYTVAPTMTITDTDVSPGSGATATCTIGTGTNIGSVTLTNPGKGYTSAPTVVFTKTGSGATFKPTVVGGVITKIDVVNPGNNFLGAPDLTITDSDVSPGSSATATCTVKDGGISKVTVTNGGSGYHQATTTVATSIPGSNVAATIALKTENASLDITNVLPSVTNYAADNTFANPTVTVLGGDNFKTGSKIVVKAVFAEDVTVTGAGPTINLSINSVIRAATFTNVDPNDPLRTLYFSYTVVSGDSAAGTEFVTVSPALNPTRVSDISGNTWAGAYSLPTTTAITVNGSDAAAPTISSVTALSGTKKIGDSVLVSVNFSQKVTVVGAPYVTITIGTATKVASYYSGSGSTALVFKYVVAEGDTGATAVGANALAVPTGSSIKNSSLVDATITHSAASSTQTVDGVKPYITTFARLLGPAYVTNDNIDFEVTFSSIVAVTGTPRIRVGIGENNRYASYTSGTGTTKLTFRYTVVAGDVAKIPGQRYEIDNFIDLNGGTIKDANGNDAVSPLRFRRPINTTTTVNA